MRPQPHGERWLVVNGGPASITLWQGKNANAVLGFAGADLSSARQAASDRGASPSALQTHPGGRHFDITGPDGHPIMISDS